MSTVTTMVGRGMHDHLLTAMRQQLGDDVGICATRETVSPKSGLSDVIVLTAVDQRAPKDMACVSFPIQHPTRHVLDRSWDAIYALRDRVNHIIDCRAGIRDLVDQ